MFPCHATMYQTIQPASGAAYSFVDVTDGLNEQLGTVTPDSPGRDHLASFYMESRGDLQPLTHPGSAKSPGHPGPREKRSGKKFEKGRVGPLQAALSKDDSLEPQKTYHGQSRLREEKDSYDFEFSDFKAHIARTSSGHELPKLESSENIKPDEGHAADGQSSGLFTKKSAFFFSTKHQAKPPKLILPRGLGTHTSAPTSPRGAPGFGRSSSTVSFIHFHNLENMSIRDLYEKRSSRGHGCLTPPSSPTRGMYPFPSVSPRIARLRAEHLFKSKSCPHTPPRQYHVSELSDPKDESDSTLVPITSDYECSPVESRDSSTCYEHGDCYEHGELRIINTVDDGLSAHKNDAEDNDTSDNNENDDDAKDASHESELPDLPTDGCPSVARDRSGSLSFATLFHRCRFERDTQTMPGTPAEFACQVLDHETLVSRMNDLLCAERVSQMTKTYNDIEAVTRLLEEKERDLELAARIGQTLLSKNKELTTRAENLEEQLGQATDHVNQLRHDLSMKDELLRFYNEDLEHEHSGESTPNEKSGSALVNVDFLEKKVQTLEDENLNLRLESAQLKTTTNSYEEKEKRLVEDCIQQLAEVNQQVESLAEELHHKVEENVHHKEEVTKLLSQVAELQKKIRKLTLENMDLHEKLTASTESQRKLTKELGSMQDKYDELFEMLEEAQDELRLARGKHKVRASGQHHHSAYNVPTDSLASELETSLQQELSESNRRAYSWKVFETARAAKRAAAKAAHRESASGTRMSLMPPNQRESDSASQGPSTYPSDVESMASDGYSADMDSLYGSNPELGQPGIPGSNDLESALKRLAMRRANELNEKDFLEEEEERRQKREQAAMSETMSPMVAKSPDPSMFRSPGSNSSWSTGTGHHYKISEKLQIVKPMEGSMTLRHWQHLATPHLGGIFEEREGVQIKGEKKLDLVEETYSLSELEEDEDPQEVHTRREQDMSLIYTFTDSTVRHPGPYRGQGDLFGSRVPSSADMSMMASDMPAHASTPKTDLERQQASESLNSSADSQSSYSMSLGLATLLQGRENTGVGRALMRASTSTPRTLATSEQSRTLGASSASTMSASSSDLNQMILSSRPGGRSALNTSTRSLPGSRSFEQAMREYEEKTKAKLADPSQKTEPLFTPGMTGQGFLQQLKNKGYSLYGLWGGGGKESSPAKESSTDEVSEPATTKPSAQSVFSNGSGVGVLGALTNFRRNGMF